MEKFFGWAAIIILIGIVFGAVRECGYEHERKMKCIEKVGDERCLQTKSQ